MREAAGGTARVAVIPGDGIGVDVTREAVRCFRAAADLHGAAVDFVHWDLGAERYLRDGVTVTDDEIRRLADNYDAILLGALGDPRVPDNRHIRDILLGLRFRLDLYVNFRPCELLDPRYCPLSEVPAGGIHIDIFRESTEGAYVNMGGHFKKGTPDEIAIQEDVNTRKGVERLVRAAFEYARAEGSRRVTMVDKANALPAAGALWRRTYDDVRAEYGEIESDVMLVDAMAMDLVRRPGRYSVLVTSNLFGDIISDLAAEVTGGLGWRLRGRCTPGVMPCSSPCTARLRTSPAADGPTRSPLSARRLSWPATWATTRSPETSTVPSGSPSPPARSPRIWVVRSRPRRPGEPYVTG